MDVSAVRRVLRKVRGWPPCLLAVCTRLGMMLCDFSPLSDLVPNVNTDQDVLPNTDGEFPFFLEERIRRQRSAQTAGGERNKGICVRSEAEKKNRFRI